MKRTKRGLKPGNTRRTKKWWGSLTKEERSELYCLECRLADMRPSRDDEMQERVDEIIIKAEIGTSKLYWLQYC